MTTTPIPVLREIIEDWLARRHPSSTGMAMLIQGLYNLERLLGLLAQDGADIQRLSSEIRNARATFQMGNMSLQQSGHTNVYDPSLLRATVEDEQALLRTLLDSLDVRDQRRG